MLLDVDDLMSIGEFSARSGLSPKRLRSYAAAGLLVPAAIDSASGYRYYAVGQLRDARLVDALREAGVPLAAVGSILDDPSAQRLDPWARHVEVDAAQRREALARARRLLGDDGPRTSDGREHKENEAMTTLRTGSRRDIGRVRASNEDAVLSDDRIAAVADGMGGGPGGELASATALALLQAAFTGRSSDELGAGARAANRAIWNHARRTAALEGMGTTLCAVGVTENGDLAVVNVGDSRAYLLRDGSLTQLTDDHSVTAERVRQGEMSQQEALDHPHRNVLTRVLGGGPDVEPDIATHAVVPGDRLLVCTDGLFNELRADEVRSLMVATSDVQATADALVELALTRGGHDNISVVVADVAA